MKQHAGMVGNPEKRSRKASMSMSMSMSIASSENNRDWAGLPINIVDCILAKLVPLPGTAYDRFGAVCRAWRHASLLVYNLKQRIQFQLTSHILPLLLLPRITQQQCPQSLFIVTLKKVLCQLFFSPNTSFCGSSKGWLITLDHDTHCFTLMNPFYIGGVEVEVEVQQKGIRRVQVDQQKGMIHLPPLDYLERETQTPISKVVLSADPALAPHDYLVMVIYGECRQRVALIKSGEQVWSYISKIDGDCDDVIYHKGLIYLTMRYSREIIICTIHPNPGQEMRVTVSTRHQECYMFPSRQHYLVESPQGDLLRVCRRFCRFKDGDDDEWYFRTSNFLVLIKLQEKWEWVTELGDMTLFLDDNHCICVSASQFRGCEPNSIYFTNHDGVNPDGVGFYPPVCGGIGIGMFNLKEGTFQPLNQPQHPPLSSIQCPVWFLPSIPESWHSASSLSA